LATIAQHFRLQIPAGYRPEMTGMPSLKFKAKVPMQIMARSSVVASNER